MKIGFSGHETFVCRQFWLKKGYDFIKSGNTFSKPDSVVDLGVGINMVTAIRFWLKGFNVLDKENEITELGNYLFDEETGRDPFLEDSASLWLLHYSIVRNEKVFIFNAFFNDFTKEKTEFTKEQLIAFLKRKTEEQEQSLFSNKTYESDANVFIRTYLRSMDGKVDVEDETSNLLTELNVIIPFTRKGLEKDVQWYKVNKNDRSELPLAILLFAILERYPDDQSISFYELLDGINSPGTIFNITEKGLEDKLKEMSEARPGELIYSDTAGNRVFQIKASLNKWAVLNEYYG